MKILCLDQASKIGFSLFEDKELIDCGTKDFNNMKDSDKRIHSIKDYVSELINKYEPNVVVLEDIFLEFGNVKSFKFSAKLQGVLIEYLLESSIKYNIIPATTWKSYIGVNTRSKREIQKEQTYSIVTGLYPNFVLEKDFDEADAIGIGVYYSKKSDLYKVF